MSASGGRAERDLSFLYGSAPPASQGFGRRAVLYRKPVHSLRVLLQIADRTSGTCGQPRAVCDVQLNPCTEQVPWASPEIQARIRRCRVLGIPDRIVHPRAGEERQGVCGNVSRETVFHSGRLTLAFRFSLSF